MSGERNWDSVASRFIERGGRSLWRSYCDGLNVDLIREWLGDARARRALKTDLFDEAVGEGLVPALLELATEVHGVDISQRVVEAACSRHPALQARVDDVRESAFADGYFDLVVSNSTLDHFSTVEELENSLEEIHRLLEPGGRLLITLDNLANPVIDLRRRLPFALLNRLGLSPFPVGVTLTPSGLRRQLSRAGFEVEGEAVIMHVPRVLAVWLCHLFERRATRAAAERSRLVATLRRAEVLSGWPSRSLTGYYTAALAKKGDAG